MPETLQSGALTSQMTNSSDVLILEEFLPYQLSVLSNIVSNSISTIYVERFGLTVPGWRVMAVLGRFSGLSAAEVAERTAMDKVAVSRAVSSLLDAGLISRNFADDDRRRSVLAFTKKGSEIYKQVVPLVLSYETELISALTPVQRATLRELLAALQQKAESLAHSFK